MKEAAEPILNAFLHEQQQDDIHDLVPRQLEIGLEFFAQRLSPRHEHLSLQVQSSRSFSGSLNSLSRPREVFR
jgi:hypothetical protein